MKMHIWMALLPRSPQPQNRREKNPVILEGRKSQICCLSGYHGRFYLPKCSSFIVQCSFSGKICFPWEDLHLSTTWTNTKWTTLIPFSSIKRILVKPTSKQKSEILKNPSFLMQTISDRRLQVKYLYLLRLQTTLLFLQATGVGQSRAVFVYLQLQRPKLSVWRRFTKSPVTTATGKPAPLSIVYLLSLNLFYLQTIILKKYFCENIIIWLEMIVTFKVIESDVSSLSDNHEIFGRKIFVQYLWRNPKEVDKLRVCQEILDRHPNSTEKRRQSHLVSVHHTN